MKKIIISISCFLFSEVGAQEIQSIPEDRMNIIKTNITAYTFRNINLPMKEPSTSGFP